MKTSTWAGMGLVGLGVWLNVPFAVLGAIFDYPGILRQPTAEVLARFQAGGGLLIATWYAFVSAALLLVPVAVLVHDALAPADGRRGSGALRLATLAGVTAGFVQAAGLIRWVFAVPGLARSFADPASSEATRAAAVVTFDYLHQYAGVALGEHLGQLATALWVGLLAFELHGRGKTPRWRTGLGFTAAGLIAAGLVEGFATVIAFDPGWLGLATPVGYVVLSIWLVATGASLMRRQPRRPETAPGSVPSSV